jgi:hypothetical protein
VQRDHQHLVLENPNRLVDGLLALREVHLGLDDVDLPVELAFLKSP